MKDQRCQPPPSSSDKIERALESISEITRLRAEATRSATEETKRSREEKGPADNKFACFGNKPSENFTAWYNNVLSKLSTASWCKLYDAFTNDVIAATTDKIRALSNHFYSSIRNALYGKALDLMDNKTS
eukprot:1634850-Ditylum_brightwellii.AAC.1